MSDGGMIVFLTLALIVTLVMLWVEAHRHNSLRRELIDRGLISNVVGDAYVADWAWQAAQEYHMRMDDADDDEAPDHA